MRSEALLTTALAAAVPLEIGLVRQLDEGQRDLLRERLAPMLQQGGDDLLYGGRLCATTFAAYTRALALLAFAPGGVTAFGLTFCATHPRVRAGCELCPDCLAEEPAAQL